VPIHIARTLTPTNVAQCQRIASTLQLRRVRVVVSQTRATTAVTTTDSRYGAMSHDSARACSWLRRHCSPSQPVTQDSCCLLSILLLLQSSPALSATSTAEPGTEQSSDVGPDAAAAFAAQQFNWCSYWYPVHVLESIDPSRPHPVQLLGKQLVLGRDAAGSWRCADGACPHRWALIALAAAAAAAAAAHTPQQQ